MRLKQKYGNQYESMMNPWVFTILSVPFPCPFGLHHQASLHPSLLTSPDPLHRCHEPRSRESHNLSPFLQKHYETCFLLPIYRIVEQLEDICACSELKRLLLLWAWVFGTTETPYKSPIDLPSTSLRLPPSKKIHGTLPSNPHAEKRCV